jgi:hypothetical protein
MSFTKLVYCQYLLSSLINYIVTHLTEHLGAISHDTMNFYWHSEKPTPRLPWEKVKVLLVWGGGEPSLHYQHQRLWSVPQDSPKVNWRRILTRANAYSRKVLRTFADRCFQ